MLKSNKEKFSDAVFKLWQQTNKEFDIKVSGHSMFPLIWNASAVTLQYIRGPFKVGEVVAIWKKNKIIVHRVLSKKWDNDSFVYVTKGDFNRFYDGEVSSEEIIARVIKLNYKWCSLNQNNTVGRIINMILFVQSYIIGRMFSNFYQA